MIQLEILSLIVVMNLAVGRLRRASPWPHSHSNASIALCAPCKAIILKAPHFSDRGHFAVWSLVSYWKLALVAERVPNQEGKSGSGREQSSFAAGDDAIDFTSNEPY